MPNIKQHLQYISITDDDVVALRGVRTLVESHADEFVRIFYDHLLAFEGTRAFLTDENKIRKLLKGQRNYLLSLFDAKFDDDYFQFRRMIGHTHFRIGLDFKWYIGAYALYLDFFLPLFQKHYHGDALRLDRVTGAFRKATLLDMSIVLEAFHEGDKAALEAAQSQVLHQEKLAAVGLLASGLAHEIGNPLASIQAVCDNQLRKHPDPAIAEKFQRIRDQVTRITNIVRQLVGYARPTPATWQQVSISESVNSALAIAKLSRSAKTVDVDLQIHESLPKPWGVPDQISQVFLNFFLNAFDAMPEQFGKLIVRTLQDVNSITVEIADNGTGMSAETLSKLFTPFFTTKDVGKGTGLGLHVCDGIIKRHGGKIAVNSQLGKGTTFSVSLPISDAPPEGVNAQ